MSAPERNLRLPVLPYVDRKELVDKNPLTAEVPCGKCQLCCKTLIVPLAHEEYAQFEQLRDPDDPTKAAWAWVEDSKTGERYGRALRRRPNGDCIFLGPGGCTIHGRAPHVCKRFDCRELFLRSDRKGRKKAIKEGKLPKSLFDRGRELLIETRSISHNSYTVIVK